MRRLLISGVVAITTSLVPLLAWADNQEVAQQIAGSLKSSGQLSDYNIAVKYQDGTVWLQGRVSDQEQMNRALKQVFQMPGVTRVVNNLSIGDADGQANKPASGQSATMNKVSSTVAAMNPLRRADGTSAADGPAGTAGRAQRIMTSAAGGQQWRPVALYQAAPPPPAPRNPEAVPPGPAVAEPVPPAPATIPVAPSGVPGGPVPMYSTGVAGGPAPTRYDQPCMPNYAWPSYAAYPNYAALTYPKQYSPTAWPYIGPFYPYPQVPLGWRKVTLQWDDGWWFLDFKDQPAS
jgi:hypothetical protein